jgi:hypothetical protein
MFELWERAAPGLDRESLEWFADASDQAEYVASNLQEVVEGIGCLIASDSPEDGRVTAGNFQSSDSLPALLFTIANVLDNIRGLNLVGDSASHRLRAPELYR